MTRLLQRPDLGLGSIWGKDAKDAPQPSLAERFPVVGVEIVAGESGRPSCALQRYYGNGFQGTNLERIEEIRMGEARLQRPLVPFQGEDVGLFAIGDKNMNSDRIASEGF